MGICKIPPSNFASIEILKIKAAPLKYEIINATMKPGYCNNLVSNNGFLCTKPRVNNMQAERTASIADSNTLKLLNPWYCSLNKTRKKREMIKMEKGIRLIQSSSISSFLWATGTKAKDKIIIKTRTGTLR